MAGAEVTCGWLAEAPGGFLNQGALLCSSSGQTFLFALFLWFRYFFWIDLKAPKRLFYTKILFLEKGKQQMLCIHRITAVRGCHAVSRL